MATIYLSEQVSTRLKALAEHQKRSITSTVHILIDFEELRMMKEKKDLKGEQVKL